MSLPILAKNFKVGLRGEEGIINGVLQEEDMSGVPVSGLAFTDERQATMKNLQSISIASRCFLFPSLVEKGLAVYKEIKGPWNSLKHIPYLVKERHQVKRNGKGVRHVVIASSKVNEMFRELLTFVEALHSQGLVLEGFCPSDFVIVEGDLVPKLWKTGIVRPPPNILSNCKLANFRDLASFLEDVLKDFPPGTVPKYLMNYVERLKEGKLEYVKSHVQMVGFGYTALRFKYILDLSRGIRSRKDSLEPEWYSLIDEFVEKTNLEPSLDGRLKAKWRNKIESDKSSLIWLTYKYQKYNDSIDDFFLCLRNLLTHLSDDTHIDAVGMYFVIDEKFPNVICEFLDKIKSYPGLAKSLKDGFKK